MDDSSSDPGGGPAVRFDTRVVVLLRNDLLVWQKLNVTAFLMSGIATSEAGLVGDPYRDADGTIYTPMLRQPVLVFSGSAAELANVRARAVAREMTVAVYTRELFSTGHDEANRAAVAAVGSADLDVVGVAVRGARNAVDRLTKGIAKHP